MAARVQMVLIMTERIVWLKEIVLVNIIQKHSLQDPPYKWIVTSGKLHATYETVGTL
jgi:hypothetical protein